jgi:hypothetical protein
MAWVSLSDALEMALKRLEIDCAATAGTVDADAEKMAAALGKQQPPSQGRTTIVGTKGIAGQGDKTGDASRGHTPPAPPISGTKFTDIPNAHAPARSVNLVLVIDNGGRRDERGRKPFVPTFRSSRTGGAARETGLRIVGGHASAHEA